MGDKWKAGAVRQGKAGEHTKNGRARIRMPTANNGDAYSNVQVLTWTKRT